MYVRISINYIRLNATKVDLQLLEHMLLREIFCAYLYKQKQTKKNRRGKFINSSNVTQETLFQFKREYFKATIESFDLRWNITEYILMYC